MNLAQNIERSQHLFPDKPALIFEGTSFTYRELNEMSNRVANALSELGISRGDRVALFLPNIPAFVAAYLGIQKIGGVPVSINSALKASEMKYIIEDSGALILITTEVLRANIPVEEISQLKSILIAEGDAKTDRALSELMANVSPTALAIEMAPDDPAALLYTSGTTGFPKGAILSHRNLVSNIRTFVDTVGTHPDDRILLFLPASHSYGQTSTLFPCLEVGATLVLYRELEIEGILKSIVDHGVTTFFGVSTIYTLLYEKASADQMQTIRRYVSGGAPLPLELAKKWRDKFGVSINEEYGSTETSLICFNQTYQPCSVGSVLEGVEVKLIDSETGQEVKPGELGEVLVRGPNVMLGYWNRPTETAQVLKEGWFHTGDIGRIDEEGYFYLVDRIKDMVNVGGLKVYPSEVENILYQHSAIAEVAVYGVPEPLLGEQVIASIILKSGDAVTAKEIVAFCRQNMADFKVPSIVELVDSLPKGRTGKILKKVLREQFQPRSSKRDESSLQKSSESIKKWISDWLETELALEPETIENDRAFADYGLNSTLAVILAQDLSNWLGQPIEPVITWNFPTIEQMTGHLLTNHVETLATKTIEPRTEATKISGFSTNTKEAELPASKMEATPQAQPEPIAVIGMGCRFPGGASTPESFWHLLHNGVDTVTDIPNSRWNVEAYYDPNPSTPGKMYVKSGSFLEGIDQFDPEFFGIAPIEAASMDPQQRLLLEVSWEALEHAGVAPIQLRDSRTGVFVGSFWDDYSALHMYADDPSQIDAYRLLSNLRGLMAGRIAYVLGLQGPVMQLDTACSSSLLAVHLAVQSLRNKECNLALAGGVALNLSPELAIGLCSMSALAPDGRCKAFDAKANGFGLGEGCGMVILKRFSDAIRDGDNIMALIRGSAINHDGRSNGLTAPNGLAQEALLKQVLENAAVKPNQIQYVETHGTGTSLGDPIEVLALANVLGQERTTPLMIGSVKTNLGHLSSAAGIASLIKVVLSHQHAEIPPNLHFNEPNPHIPWDKLPLRVPTEPTPWTGEPRLAGVSSFGMTGTNAHVLLEAFEEKPTSVMSEAASRTLHILPLSAKTVEALQTLVTHYVEWLDKHHDAALTDICFTAAIGRNHFVHRTAIVADSRESLTENLTKLVQGQTTQTVFVGHNKQAPKLAMLFTGQGSQYSGMAQGLYETQPVFRQTLDRCATILEPLLDIPLIALLFDPAYTDKLNQTRYTQPALFAIEVALYELWKSIGIEPDMVIGHSVGEYAAAYAAGIMGLETGLKLIAKRAELMGALPLGGTMAAIFVEPESLQQTLTNSGLTLAADNGTHSVVSGSKEDVEALIEHFKKTGVRCQRLVTSHAFHSPLLEPMLDTFATFADSLKYQPAERIFISNLTGNVWPSEARLDGNYWRDHARQPVQFIQGIQTLAKNDCQVILEIGPHPVLTAMALDAWPYIDGQSAPLTLTSLHRKQPGERPFTEACAQLYAAGAIINWAAWDQPWPQRKLSLPSYPFQRQHYWINQEKSMISSNHAIEKNYQTTVDIQPRKNTILPKLRTVIAELFQLSPSEIELDMPLLEMGADSIIIGQAVRKIEKLFGITLTIRQFFDELKTLDALAAYIEQNLPHDWGFTESPSMPKQQALPQNEELTSQKPESEEKSKIETTNSTLERVLRQQLETVSQTVSQAMSVVSQQLELLKSGHFSTQLSSENHYSRQVSQATTVETSVVKSTPPITQTPVTDGSEQTNAQSSAFWGGSEIQSKQLTVTQQHHLDTLIARYTKRTQKSKQQEQTYRPVFADMRSTLIFRPETKEMCYPIIAESAQGSKLWDLDGNEYIDLTMGFGVHLFGHQPDFITEALEEQLKEGTQIGPQSKRAGEVAELICEMTGMDRVTFCNSGTEAVMAALRIARAATGRDKVVLFSGAYHGHFDGTLAINSINENQPGAAAPMATGVLQKMVDDVLVLPYGTPQTLSIIKTYAHQLAAVLVEPVQSRHPDIQPKTFLQELRKVTEASGTTLIFDEMITGFRIHPRGAQAWFGVDADIVTYGKVVGGGMPIGIVAGKADYMARIDGGIWQYGDASYPQVEKTFYGGTFCKHLLAMATARAVLRHLKKQGPILQKQLNQRTTLLAETLNGYCKQHNMPIRVVNFGSLFRFALASNFSYLYQPLEMDLLYYHLIEKGIYIWEGRICFLSTAHTQEDIEKITQAVKESIEELRAGEFIQERLKKKRIEVGKQGTDITSRTLLTLTETQKQLWLLAQMADKGPFTCYTVAISLQLKGLFNLTAMRQAVQKLVERHEALRTTIHNTEEQYILSSLKVDITLIDFLDNQDQVTEWMTTEIKTPFNLNQGLLFRCHILKLEEQRHVLVLVIHHLIADGLSMGIILEELAALYSAECQGVPYQLSTPLQFSELMHQPDDQIVSHHELYLKQFERVCALELPTDHPRSSIKSFLSHQQTIRLEVNFCRHLKKVSQNKGFSLFMMILSGYLVLLHRLTGQADIIVGIPCGGRTVPGSETVVGNCRHLIPIRSGLVENQTFAEYLATLKQLLLEAYEHQDYAFAKLFNEWLAQKPSLIATTFNLDQVVLPNLFKLKIEAFSSPPINFSVFEMSFNVLEIENELVCDCDYNPEVFEATTIRRWLGYFQTLLEKIVANPNEWPTYSN